MKRVLQNGTSFSRWKTRSYGMRRMKVCDHGPVSCCLLLTMSLDIVLIELPVQRPESYTFSVPLTSVYSLIVQPPTLSSWCEYLFDSRLGAISYHP